MLQYNIFVIASPFMYCISVVGVSAVNSDDKVLLY